MSENPRITDQQIREQKCTVRETATHIKKSEETVRRMLRRGDVFPHAYRVTDGWLIPWSDIRKYLKKARLRATTYYIGP